jgi:hypothetical protein
LQPFCLMEMCLYCERMGLCMMSVDWTGVGEALVWETRNTRRRVTEARCILVTALVLIVW